MPAKLSLLCLINSVSEKDSSNYIIREAIAIIRKEDNTSMDLKLTSFIPKSSSAPRWIPLFEPDNILRLTGKFILEEEPPHGILQITANAGDLIEISKDNLPTSSVSVFITGFVVDQVQNDDNIFKSIKIITSEFAGNNTNKFYIKCRYLKTDERIEKKATKMRKNSSVMITGELTLVNSEFKIEIQDLNFLSTTIGNIESSSTTSSSASSLYSWPTTPSSRMSAQKIANTLTPQNSIPNNQPLNIVTNNELINDENSSHDDDDDTSPSTQTPPNTRTPSSTRSSTQKTPRGRKRTKK
ncbi:unnamed protein product [Rhizophagus irregularis]|uniref:Uncharacterized protein n=2 Tax=Rhizophagus irregularis TaxID=588596 RepID=A0A2I1HBY6_9GLOM|nr:hypothetical protein RhiirA4_507149 [Rhizophagus irregularis]CAB4414360.1 unnamed protein product [Rhizophagus irregularis]